MSLSAYNQDIKLPEPNRKGGMPLMQALNERKSSREYDSRKLSEQQLSDLLWAAWGINRPEDGKHTAPSSNDKQEMSVYVADLIKSGVAEPEKAGPETLNKSNINTGFMAQNVYLWCASEKLACVVRAFIDIPVLTKAMELAPYQRIIISQTV